MTACIYPDAQLLSPKTPANHEAHIREILRDRWHPMCGEFNINSLRGYEIASAWETFFNHTPLFVENRLGAPVKISSMDERLVIGYDDPIAYKDVIELLPVAGTGDPALIAVEGFGIQKEDWAAPLVDRFGRVAALVVAHDNKKIYAVPADMVVQNQPEGFCVLPETGHKPKADPAFTPF